jgi:hypothetical protein
MKNNSGLIIGIFTIIIGSLYLFYKANYVERFSFSELFAKINAEHSQRITSMNAQIAAAVAVRKQEATKTMTGKEGDLVDFGCTVESGEISYGANGITNQYVIPSGTRSLIINNSLIPNSNTPKRMLNMDLFNMISQI